MCWRGWGAMVRSSLEAPALCRPLRVDQTSEAVGKMQGAGVQTRPSGWGAGEGRVASGQMIGEGDAVIEMGKKGRR